MGCGYIAQFRGECTQRNYLMKCHIVIFFLYKFLHRKSCLMLGFNEAMLHKLYVISSNFSYVF